MTIYRQVFERIIRRVPSKLKNKTKALEDLINLVTE